MICDQEFVVANRLGIHARVAAQIVKCAGRFDAEVTITKDGHTVDGKSILDVMTLACPQWGKLRVCARGPDAEEALRAIESLFQAKFGEA